MSKLRLLTFLIAAAALFSCTKPENEQTGFSNVKNPREEQLVSVYGETVTVTFDAQAAWTAEIVCEGDWAQIKATTGNAQAGRGGVKIQFEKNSSMETRKATLYVKVDGFARGEMAVFEQSSGMEDNAMNDYLISEMEKRLSTEYLWAKEYNAIDKTVVPYDEYLFTNLTKLGDVNIEDGGKYRAYSSYAGERYIYSYIQEIEATKAPELTSTYGLGLGPIFASKFDDDPNSQIVGLTIGYVYRDSPVDKAGMRRGDIIWAINGNLVTYNNYQAYMSELFYNPSGEYELVFARYVLAESGDRYDLVQDNEIKVTAASFGYDPILFAAIMKNNDEATEDGSSEDEGEKYPDFCIGYLATESFDMSAQFVIEDQIKQFVDAGITDLILDLRFNVGGAVPQSRYISSAIAGQSHNNDIFFKAEYVDGRKEDWTFGYGYINNPDGLTAAPDLGLSRLFVIVSENTASASELLINGLRGIDFPVTMIGSRTEGKNVGMVVSTISYNGRKFEFAPITFRCSNAKDEGDYKDGFIPEGGNLLNNQNKSYDDDIDNVFPYAFGDWGDFNFNYALYFCFCDILGIERPNFAATKSMDTPMMQAYGISHSARELQHTAVTPQIGRFGNVIYK
ncbi:MAG: S41 family peptidase [Candidatus Cryptobacteroides sp.]